jgi:hypothetical protein
MKTFPYNLPKPADVVLKKIMAFFPLVSVILSLLYACNGFRFKSYSGGILSMQNYFAFTADKSDYGFKIPLAVEESSNENEEVSLVSATNLAAWKLLSKKDFSAALEVCPIALELTEDLQKQVPNTKDVAGSLGNLAISKINTGDLSYGPEELLKRALLAMKNTPEPEEYTCKLNTYLGDLYFFRGDDEHASKFYEAVEDMHLIGAINDQKAAAAFEHLGIIEWRAGKIKRAESLLGEALFAKERRLKPPDQSFEERRLITLLHSLRNGFRAPAKKNEHPVHGSIFET